MAKLTLEEYSDNFLYLKFECEPIGSSIIYVNYYDGTENKFISIDVEPGVDIVETFYLQELDPGTEYYVSIFDDNDNFLVGETFATAVSRNKPKVEKFSIHVKDGKITAYIIISNLNSDKIIGNLEWAGYVDLSIDGKTVGNWWGDSLSNKVEVADGSGYDIERGTLTIDEEYDFPDTKDACILRIYANNSCSNMISGHDIYFEETYRETEIVLPFSWDIAKVTGEKIRLSAAEWNRFIDKLKKRLQSKGIQYSKVFTTAESAGLVGRNVGTAADGLSIDSPKVISKSILCEAVDALNAMLPADERISYPTGISASFLNNIVDKLNSI